MTYTSEKWSQAYITCSLLFSFGVVLRLSAAEYKALIRVLYFYTMFSCPRGHFDFLSAAANDAETNIFWKKSLAMSRNSFYVPIVRPDSHVCV